MAGGNYDSLAINEEGKITNGVFISPLGIKVEIYKNWLYVYDGVAWQKNSYMINPCIMEIQTGDILYKDVAILACRGPQDGVFCVASHCGDKTETFKFMIGCGVYGYRNNDFIGVDEDSISFLKYLARNIEKLHNSCWWSNQIEKMCSQFDFDKLLRYNSEDYNSIKKSEE